MNRDRVDGGCARVATRWVSGAMLTAALAGAGCAKSGLEVGCTQGLVRSCPCIDGTFGVQRCLADRTYGACQCDARDGGSGSACTGLALASGCRVGRCMVSAPLGALGERAVLTVTELPVPEPLLGDAIGPSLCEVRAIDGAAASGVLRLSIRLDERPPTDATLFERGRSLARILSGSFVSDSSVETLIPGAGTFGVTRRPGRFSITETLGVDQFATDSGTGLLRNVSNAGISAAFWDGTRLYIGSGRRVLVYRTLRPRLGQRPDLVLGQPDLQSNRTEITASTLSSVNSIWSDGTQLIVSDGSRLLIWKSIPTRDFTAADIVLGQRDFGTNQSNASGISASSLAGAAQVTSDGRRLAVADSGNHRVLVWDRFPSVSGAPADRVIGQVDFNTGASSSGAATPLYLATGVALGVDHLWVTGYSQNSGGLHRVALDETRVNPAPELTPVRSTVEVQPDNLFRGGGVALLGDGALAVRVVWGAHIALFRSPPTTTRASSDLTLGYPTRLREVLSLESASTLDSAPPLSGRGSVLLAADGGRLLVWERTPQYTFEPASFVWGQGGASTNIRAVDYRGISEQSLGAPADVAVRGSVIAVADRGNNRVLLFDRDRVLAGDRRARLVLGQPDFRSFAANRDRDAASADSLSAPSGVAIEGSRLFVADSANHRVLVWSALPTTNGQPADIVLGQVDFMGSRPNHGLGDVSPRDGVCDADGMSLFEPVGVAASAAALYVADRVNNRVLRWDTSALRNGAPASAVLGQMDATSVVANRGLGSFVPSPDGFNLPMGVTVDGDGLWVADTENNRVVFVERAASEPRATRWIGQRDGRTVANPQVAPTGSGGAGTIYAYGSNADNALTPRGVARVGDTLVVSEFAVHRLHLFSAITGAPMGVVAQRSETAQDSNAGGVSAASLSRPLGIAADVDHLWVADSRNHRVVAHPLPLARALSSSATHLLGQELFVRSGFNQSSAARGPIVRAPLGLARDQRSTFVADAGFHRVLRFDSAPGRADGWTASSAPSAIYGQPDDSLTLPNRGGRPSEATLDAPSSVSVRGEVVVIADSNNHRVTIYDRASTNARLVLGQPTFADVRPNRGGPPSAATLQNPQAVLFDGERLFVADTANHRVLVWRSLPTQNGQPADAVLGQRDATAIEGNRGSSTPSAATMLFPVALHVIGDSLFVADSGNNRVLRFDRRDVLRTGAEASLVLGQRSADERQSALEVGELDRMSGPRAIDDDGVYLFVLDRDLSRVLRYSLPSLSARADSVLVLRELGSPSIRGASGLLVRRTPYFTTELLVSDTANARVLRAAPSMRAE
jgi:hypothetical protein